MGIPPFVAPPIWRSVHLPSTGDRLPLLNEHFLASSGGIQTSSTFNCFLPNEKSSTARKLQKKKKRNIGSSIFMGPCIGGVGKNQRKLLIFEVEMVDALGFSNLHLLKVFLHGVLVSTFRFLFLKKEFVSKILILFKIQKLAFIRIAKKSRYQRELCMRCFFAFGFGQLQCHGQRHGHGQTEVCLESPLLLREIKVFSFALARFVCCLIALFVCSFGLLFVFWAFFFGFFCFLLSSFAWRAA